MQELLVLARTIAQLKKTAGKAEAAGDTLALPRAYQLAWARVLQGDTRCGFVERVAAAVQKMVDEAFEEELTRLDEDGELPGEWA